MGLRIKEGIQLAKLEQLLHQPADQLLNIKNIHHLCDLNYITFENGNLAVTTQGKLLLNKIVEQIIN